MQGSGSRSITWYIPSLLDPKHATWSPAYTSNAHTEGVPQAASQPGIHNWLNDPLINPPDGTGPHGATTSSNPGLMIRFSLHCAYPFPAINSRHSAYPAAMCRLPGR